jgi:hypothetical protein
VTETPRESWAVAQDAAATVALDLHVTPDLRKAGIAREAIRQIQEARKSSRLEGADRTVPRYQASQATPGPGWQSTTSWSRTRCWRLTSLRVSRRGARPIRTTRRRSGSLSGSEEPD